MLMQAVNDLYLMFSYIRVVLYYRGTLATWDVVKFFIMVMYVVHELEVNFAGDSEMYDSETPISVFFGQVLSAKFNE